MTDSGALQTLLHLVEHHGLWLVFACVLIDQGGIPVPAYPPIIVTAAVAANRGEAVWPILVVAVLAALLADAVWYAGGRRYGARMLRLICRLSVTPDSCVLTTRGTYARWGPPSLVVAKFVPGFAAVATTLAGDTRTALRRFFFYDGIGALLWAGLAVMLGTVFHRAVDRVIDRFEAFGRYALPLLLALVALFIAWKLARRWLFLRQLRAARITPDELLELMETGAHPLILDVRAADQRERTGSIPGAIFVATLDQAPASANGEVVVYCDCPNEASAATLARELRRRGVGRVRVLAGGFSAWQSARGARPAPDADQSANAA